MEVFGDQARDRRDGHARVVKGRGERADDVALRNLPRLQHHDAGPGRAPDARLQRVTGAEALDRAHDLVGGSGHAYRSRGHDHDLAVGCPVCREAFEAGIERGAGRRHDDDRGRGRGRLVETRWHAPDGAVDDLAVLAQVRRERGFQVEGRPVVDDSPASRLDARLELIGSGEVACAAGDRAFLGQRHDLGGC